MATISSACEHAVSAAVEGPLTLSLGSPPHAPSQIRVARGVGEVLQAWRLVYENYHSKGLIDAHPFQLHTVPHAVQRGTTVVLRRHGGRVVGTVSSYPDGRRGLPLDKVYGRELDTLRRTHGPLGEVGLFADQGNRRGDTVRDLFTFMSYPVYNLYHQQMSQIVIGVHPRHVGFYCNMLGFVVAGPCREYGLVRNHPVVLLRFDLRRLDSHGPAPRGLRHWREHPLASDTFAQRFDFAPSSLARSDLPAYLRWLERNGTSRVAPESETLAPALIAG